MSSTTNQGAYVFQEAVLHNKTTSKTGEEILQLSALPSMHMCLESLSLQSNCRLLQEKGLCLELLYFPFPNPLFLTALNTQLMLNSTL